MPSANDFATRALQSIGVADAIDTISSEDAALALNVLNEWIDQLGIQRNTIYTVKRQTHTLASGTSSYTIGSSGTINVARPIWIEDVGLILDTGSSTPVEVPRQLFTDDEYAGIAQKTLQSGLIQGIWFDHEWVAGLGNIHVWPVPNVSTTQLVQSGRRTGSLLRDTRLSGPPPASIERDVTREACECADARGAD